MRPSRPAAAASLVIALAACSWTSDAIAEPDPLCPVLAIVVPDIMGPADASFAGLVAEDRPTTLNRAVGGGLSLQRGDEDLGAAGVVIDYLIERREAWDPSTEPAPPVPDRTDEIEEQAEALDRELADGRCDPA